MNTENNEIVRGDYKLDKIMNNHSTNNIIDIKVKSTKVDPKPIFESMIDAFQNCKRIQRIMLAIWNSKSSLKFENVSEHDVRKEILNLFFIRKGGILAKILKESINT